MACLKFTNFVKKIIPVSLKFANDFVQKNHRHNKPVQGHKFSIAAYFDGKIVGVAISGRPIARNNDNGLTLEILRVCTDGTPHANSFLYGAVRRIAQAMGYLRVITYTLESESGSSLKAVNGIAQKVKGGGWNRTGRKRKNQLISLQNKLRWELI